MQAGLQTTLTGRPADVYHLGLREGKVHEQDDVVTVMHDFEDGLGLMPVERRLASDGESYFHLRAGEFAFFGLPDGPVSLTASLCDMVSAPLIAHVTTGHTTNGLALALPQYILVQNGDSIIPSIVTWKSTEPEDGFVVSVAAEGDRVVYTPSPPNMKVTLQAPPYSRGATIVGIEIEYSWMQADGTSASLKATRIPIAPLMVPSSSLTCPGAPVSLHIPLGTAELAGVFQREEAGQVVAKARFVNEDGFILQGLNLEALTVAANLRRL